MLTETLKLALHAIRRNALRSFLTVLGIVIGVGAVIAMVTIGSGTTQKVTAELAKLGANLLFVRPGQWGPGRASATARPFKAADIETIRAQVGGILAVAPVAGMAVTAVYGTESRSTSLTGTDNAFFVARDWPIARGRQFLEGELRSGRAACVIGDTIREKLFLGADPLGLSIRINKIACEVVGVLQAKGESSRGSDQDDLVVIPIRAFHRRFAGNTDIANIFVSASNGADSAKVQAGLERLLRERRKITANQDDDFTVRDTKQLVESLTGTTSAMTGLLGAVASVSLLVGGIGIMNIMLVSVTERTREIGIRLAIGALERQVLTQFLIEAVVLSAFGGIIGIAVGLGLAWLATGVLRIPFVLDPTIVVVAFAFSALVGVVFGYFPARRAARLDPIEALRHE